MTAIATDALCGLADVKESLGITNTTQDNLIVRKINEASKVIQNYCQNSFSSVNYVEQYDGAWPSRILVLRHSPVISFTKLEYRSTNTNDPNFTTVTSNLYFVDNASGTIKFLDIFWGDWAEWQATYSAGYSTVPADVAEACATLASYLVLHPFGGTGVQEIREGSRQVNYQRQVATAKTTILQVLGLDVILDPYVNVVVSGDR